MDDHQTPSAGEDELRAQKAAAWDAEHREMSYGDMQDMLSSAAAAKFQGDGNDRWLYVLDFGDDWLVYSLDGEKFRCSYEVDGDAVTLGDPEPVRASTTYEPVEANAVSLDLEQRRRRAADLDGALECRRFDASQVEIREISDGMLRFTGYASVTERGYEVGDFQETIARGAFKRTLSENPDVVLLLNHDGLPLARTKSGTLTLAEDARGLRVDADLNPADPDVQRVRPKLERGDVDEMSFAFRATSQEWNDDYTQRRITGVTIHKGDVSIVTYGANDASTGGLAGLKRSLDEELVETRSGKTLSSKTRSELEAIRDSIDELLSSKDQPKTATESNEAGGEGERAADTPLESPRMPVEAYTMRDRERLAQLRRVA